MTSQVPRVLFRSRWSSADEIEAVAAGWAGEILAHHQAGSPVAAIVPPSPEGVSLIAALSALPIPAVLLSSDGRLQPGHPMLPPGTPVAIPPSVAGTASAARELGGRPFLLGVPADRRKGAPLQFLRNPGFVLYSSGTTGSPKPVFRATGSLVEGPRARLAALGLKPGAGILAGVSMAHGHGLTRLISAMVLGGPFGLLEPLDHRAALHALAMEEFTCWSATAHFADVLGRCTLTAPPVVPRVCLLSSPISRRVFDAFVRRFGVPLRQNYSSSETGAIAVNAAEASDVRHDTVGQPVPGVEVRLGEDPDGACEPGVPGRVWVKSPWLMEGYGVPSGIDRSAIRNGWFPTRDIAVRNSSGELTLAGRIDDRIRTRDGRIVDLSFVASSLRAADGVRDVAVVPIQGDAGAAFGAVFECEASLTVAMLQERLSGSLPPWARPRMMAIVKALPRLPNGKADHPSCLAALMAEAS